MGFSDLLSGGLLGSVGSVISSGFNALSANKQTKKMIQAQKEMNERNIQAQQDINTQNINFQREINDIMRHDNNNAISIKKRDLQNAGYSTANPDLQGMPAASLGSPQLTAPQVQSEYTPDMARQQLDAGTSFASSLLNSASTHAQIALARAQTKETNSRATGQEISNSWLDAQLKANYKQTLANTDNILSQTKLNDKQREKVVKEFDLIDGQLNLIASQYVNQQYKNAYEIDTLEKNLQLLGATINKIKAETADARASANLKYRQSVLTGFESRLKQIQVGFAEMGINFNSNDLLSTLLRISSVPGNGSALLDNALDFIGDFSESLFDNFGEALGSGLIIGAGSGLIKGLDKILDFPTGGYNDYNDFQNNRNNGSNRNNNNRRRRRRRRR